MTVIFQIISILLAMPCEVQECGYATAEHDPGGAGDLLKLHHQADHVRVSPH